MIKAQGITLTIILCAALSLPCPAIANEKKGKDTVKPPEFLEKAEKDLKKVHKKAEKDLEKVDKKITKDLDRSGKRAEKDLEKADKKMTKKVKKTDSAIRRWFRRVFGSDE